MFLDLNLTGTATAAMALAIDRGHRVVLLTRDRREYAQQDPDPLQVASEIIDVDTFDVSSVVRTCLPLAPVALIAFDDYRLLPAAAARAVLGLPGPAATGVAAARFKDETRRRTADLGRPVRHAVVPLRHAPPSSPVGYPCVVKPLDDSASAGVSLCQNDAEYVAAVAAAVDHTTHGRGYRCADAVLVEEALDGDEYSAELVWDPHVEIWRPIGLTQTFLSPPPWRRETGHLFPAPLDATVARTVLAQACAWVDRLGMRGGVAHVELKLTTDGPALIEVNPRPPGGNIPTLVKECTGVDLVSRYLELHLPAPPPLLASPAGRAAALRFVVPEGRGTVVSLTLDASDRLDTPGLLARRLDPSMVGRRVGPTTYLAHVIVVGDDPATAWQRADLAHQQIHVELEPAGGTP